jgi:hypothetical protein
MVGTFKANIPYNNFLLFVYGFVLYLPMFLHPVAPVKAETDVVLYVFLINTLSFAAKSFPLLFSIVSFILIFIQALMLNMLVNNQRLQTRPSYLTGMCYLLFTAVFTKWYGLSASLIASTFLIWILTKLCNLQNNPHPKTSLYNIGLLLGVTTFFYFPSLAFIFLVLMGITITRPFRFSEWIIAFVGIITPYYFLLSYNFLLDKKQPDFSKLFDSGVPSFFKTGTEYAALTIIVIVVLLGIYWVQDNMRRLLVQSRNTWAIIYIFMLISLVIPFLNRPEGLSNWRFSVIPFSCFASAFFLFPLKKWISVVAHWALVLLAFWMGYIYITH